MKENLRITGLADRAEVVRDDLPVPERTTESFDIVYVAPPQYLGLWEKALQALDREKSAAGDLVVVQIHPKEYHPVELQYLELEDERKYGSTQVLFYVRREGGTDATSEGREDLDEGR